MSDLSTLLAQIRSEKRHSGDTQDESPDPTPANGETRPELYELRRALHANLSEKLGRVLYDQDLGSDRLLELIRGHVEGMLQENDTPMSAAERQSLIEDLENDVLGHGPIEEFLQDPSVTEVMVNGPDEIFVERKGKITRTAQRFADESHLRTVIDGIVGRVGRRIDESSPMVDARLPDGSRVNAVIHPLAIKGPFLTIRKFSKIPFTDRDLIRFGTMTKQVADFLRSCVEGKLNMIISGGTGAGKTSTLNVLSSYIPDDERIVTVEDSLELRLNQPHALQMEARPPNLEGKGQVTIRELVRNSLRMRPDRIVVGEVRGAEALDMLQAMNTGHDGSISTLHSNNPRDGMSRLETMVLMAGVDLPVRAIREQIASAVDIVVHQSRLRDGTRRITHVTELEGMEGDTITLSDIFLFDYGMGMDEHGKFLGHLKPTGIRPKFVEKLGDQGIHVPAEMFIGEEILKAHDQANRG